MNEKKPEMKQLGGLTPQQAGEKRLEMRVKRLARLVELKSPPAIMARETLMIADAMWLAYPEDMAKQMLDREHTRVKTRAGYCSVKDCESPAQVDEEVCPLHLAEIESSDLELDDLN
jgi:hypothetical protein